MVGGFAQESLFSARGPATGLSDVWMVGDSIFPGQSTAGVTVGAMRFASAINNFALYGFGMGHAYLLDRLIISLDAYQPVNIAMGTPEGVYAH